MFKQIITNKILLIIGIIFIKTTLFANNINKFDTIFYNILNLNFYTAQQQLDKSKLNEYKKKYLTNYALFLKTFINQEQQDFNEFVIVSNQNIKYFNNLNDSLPEKLFYISETKLQLAVNDFIFGYYYKSATNFLSSYYTIKKNNEKFPQYIKNNKLSGIFEIILGNIPQDYNLVKKLLSLNGNIKSGTQRLKSYYKSIKSTPEKIEADIILYFALKNFTNKNTYYDFNKNINNPLIIFTYANYLTSTDSTIKAINILNSYKPNNNFKFYYIYYQKGLLKLYNLDKSAKKDLLFFTDNFDGINYIKSAYEKIYWYNIIFNNDTENIEIKNKIENRGNTTTDEDKQAIKNIENPYTNVILLKSRLLFDGSFYKKALRLLIENKNSKLYNGIEEKLEYLYRLARVYDKLNKTEKAIHLYKKVISFGEYQPFYFAANSALSLAEIYEKQKNFTQAKFFYNKCLSINNYGYKNSIELKAKAGLNRIKH